MHLQELGLRDAAVFEAWITVPEAVQIVAEEESEEDLFPRVTALPSLTHRTYPHERAQLTPRDLTRASRLHEPDEVQHNYQGEVLEDGSAVCPACSLNLAAHEYDASL